MEEKKVKKLNSVYQFASKRKKRLALFGSLLSLAVLLAVNVYAWFVYIAKSDLTLSANVVGWSVTFSDGKVETDNLEINVIDAYPGMTPYQNRVYITNSGELNSTFRYEVDSINIMGYNVIDKSMTQQQIIESLKTTYPFNIDLTFSGDKMAPGESITFDTEFSWEYENEREYFKLDKYHVFDKTIKYYTFDGTNYNVENVTEENFAEKKQTLYMHRDDADGFFGIRCADYVEQSGKACVQVNLKLYVEQTK